MEVQKKEFFKNKTSAKAVSSYFMEDQWFKRILKLIKKRVGPIYSFTVTDATRSSSEVHRHSS